VSVTNQEWVVLTCASVKPVKIKTMEEESSGKTTKRLKSSSKYKKKNTKQIWLYLKLGKK
jgi:hypothetical protein